MQPTENNIHLPELTPKENTAYNLNGAGLQAKEIADKMGVAYETVKSYMKSIKEKLGLQIDKEITAHFYCKMMGKDFAEIKKQIIASCLLLIFLLYVPTFLLTPMRGRTNGQNQFRQNVTARVRRYEAPSGAAFHFPITA